MKNILLATFIVLAVSINIAQIPDYQSNCPGVPCIRQIPESKLIEIGDDEIHLGEGVFTRNNYTSTLDIPYNYWNAVEFRWPCNRPMWPIAIAHAWAMFRSISGIEKHNINSYSSILINETLMSCDAGLDYSCMSPSIQDPNQFGSPFIPLVTDHNAYSPTGIAVSDGCFQIDNLGRQALIEGSSACGSCGFYDEISEVENLVTGDAFETAVISRSFYDLIFLRKMELVEGLNPVPVFNAAPDEYADLKVFSKAYNQGHDAVINDAVAVFGTPAARANASASNEWLGGTPLGWWGYSAACTFYTRVLNDDYTPSDPNDLQYWLDWYDNDISWALMDDYLTTVFPLFDLDPAEEATIRAQIQVVFNAQADAAGNVSYRYKLGPVIDEIVKLLPFTDPGYNMTSSQSAVNQCGGCVGPYVTIDTDYSNPICDGNSVELETIYGSGYTYTWIRNETAIPNPNPDPQIFYATESGTYSVVVQDEKGCAIRSDIDVEIVVNNCSSCDLDASFTEVNNTCTDIGDGSIEVNLSGGDYSLGNTYNFILTDPFGNITNSNNSRFTGLIQGTYQVQATQVGNASCAAFGTVTIEEDELVYQSVEISENAVRCDEVDLQADIVGNPPATCDYNLRIESNQAGPQCWGETWQSTDYRLSIDINGVSIGERTPVPVNGECILFEEDFGVSDGDLIEVVVKNIRCGGGGSMNRNFILTDPLNNEIAGFLGTLNDGPNIAVTTVASCERPDVNYNLDWSANPGGNVTNVVAGNNTGTATGIGTSWVRVEATSASNNCTLVDSIQIIDSCGGVCANPGTVTLNVSGNVDLCTPVNESITASISGVGTFEYSFDGGITWGNSNNRTITTGGNYGVMVRDANDPTNPLCIVTSPDIYTINEIDVPSTPAFTTTDDQVCQSENGVNYEIGAVAGATGYTWNYTGTGATINGSGTSVTVDFSGAATSGNIDVTADNACGSSAAVSFAVNVNQGPDLVVNDPAAICEPGTIDITSAWNDNNNTGAGITYHNGTPANGSNQIANESAISVAGTYYILADNNGCTDEAPVVVDILSSSDPACACPSSAILSVNGSNQICPGSGDQVTLEVNFSGSGPYDFTINGGGSPIVVNGHNGASYTVDVSDVGTYTLSNFFDQGESCDGSVSGSVDVSEFSLPTASFDNASETICDNGTDQATFNITTSAGVTELVYNDDSSDITLFSPFQINASTAGTFTLVSVTDANCTASISGNALLDNHATWDTSNVSFACQPSDDFIVSFDVTNGNTDDYTITGANGSAAGSSWTSDPIAELTPVNITIEDQYGCESITISGTASCSCPSSASLSVNGNDQICPSSGDQVSLVVNFSGNGPYDFVINGGSTPIVVNGHVGNSYTVDVSETGTYTLSDFFDQGEGNCQGSTSGSVTVSEFVLPTVSFASSDQTICDGALSTLAFTTSAEVTEVVYNDGSSDVSLNAPFQANVGAGTYSLVSVSDANCSAPASGSIVIDYHPDFSVSTPALTCQASPSTDFVITMSMTGGTAPFNVSGASGNMVGSDWTSDPIAENTMINLTVTDDVGCQTETMTNLTTSCACEAVITDIAVSGSNEICNDGSDATNISVQFNDGTLGSFDVTLLNQTTGSTVSASQPFGSSLSIPVTEAGNYVVQSFSAAGATGACGTFDPSDIALVTARILPSASITSNALQSICANTNETATLEVSISGGSPAYELTYSIDGGTPITATTSSNTLSVPGINQAGTFELVGISDQFCAGTVDNSSMTVSIHTPVTPVISPDAATICVGDNVTLSATNPGSNSVDFWRNGNVQIVNSTNQPSIVFEATSVGTANIIVQVTDQDCSQPINSDPATITVNERPVVSAGGDREINVGESITLNGTVNPNNATITWSPNTYMSSGTENTITPLVIVPENDDETSIVYTVQASLGNCTDTDNMILTVTREIEIFNTFSPNGDGTNDTWTILGLEKYAQAKIKVFNRWGQVVYDSNAGYTEKWDGQFNGSSLPTGTYYYILELNDPSAASPSMTGSVTIVR